MTDTHQRLWQVQNRTLELGAFPQLMGIINATPDSFSDGGEFLEPSKAVDQAMKLLGEGADVLDVGGESTRPGADVVSETEELKRVLPVIEGIRSQSETLISIDTTKAKVAAEAVAAGANIINDISGLTFDPEMLTVCQQTNTGIICMHIKGTPQTMQDDPTYDNVVNDVKGWLNERLEWLESEGISTERIMLDPGIGFGKTAQHNVELLSNIAELRSLGRPVLIGHSRKRFLQKVLGRAVNERTFGTTGVAVALAQQHTDLIRVHDVQTTRDTLLAWYTISESIPQSP